MAPAAVDPKRTIGDNVERPTFLKVYDMGQPGGLGVDI